MNARDPLLPVQPDESEAIATFTSRMWDEQIVPQITDYIRVPAKSPMFDPDWAKNGHLEQVIRDAATWVEGCQVAGLKLEVVRIEGRTPVLFFDVPATRPGGHAAGADTCLLYGHLDTQPEFSGWRNDLGPWTPKYVDGLLVPHSARKRGNGFGFVRLHRQQGVACVHGVESAAGGEVSVERPGPFSALAASTAG